jgi:hypothetical protein
MQPIRFIACALCGPVQMSSFLLGARLLGVGTLTLAAASNGRAIRTGTMRRMR